MRRIIGCFAISGCVGVCFTSAVVLAQVGGGAAVPAPAPAQEKEATVKKLTIRAKGNATVDKDGRAATVEVKDAAGIVVQKQVILQKAVRQPGQPNRAPLIQQFTNQSRPLLRAELIFARNVCHLNREELRKVNRAAQAMLDEVVAKLVDAQVQPRIHVQAGGRMPNNLDAHQLLQDGVVSIMKTNLSTGQWSVYEAERQKRDENRKRTTIRYFVDSIDRELFLSREQGQELAAAFKDQWDPAWTMYLENHLLGNKYYPMTVDPLVAPILTEAQKKVWGGVQKVGVYWGFSGMIAGFANDGDGLEVELGEPARLGDGPNGINGMMRKQMQHMGGGVIEAVPAPPVLPPTTVRIKGVLQNTKAKRAEQNQNIEKKVGKAGD